MKKLIFILIISLIVIASCKKEIEKEVIIEKEYSWKRLGLFSGSNGIVLNSFAAKNKIYFSVVNAWCWLDTANNYEGYNNGENYLNYSIRYKIPITDKIFAYYGYWGLQGSSGVVTINSTANSTANYLPNYFLLKLDTSATYIDEIFRKKNCIAISNSSYCLIPTHTKQFKPAFYIIKPHLQEFGNELFVDYNVKNSIIRKTIIENEQSSYIRTIDSYFDKFFVSCNSNAYSIDTLGNSTPIIKDMIWQFFQKSDSIIAISYKYDTYVSTDKGTTWNKSLSIPQKDFTNSNACLHLFCNINNELIAYPGCEVSSLYHIKLINGQYVVKQIKLDGLEGCDITSISYFNNKVYITTLSGVFVKDWDKFIDYNVTN